ncbi:PDDEXK-like family protein [Ancylomarina sp. YFZ004]
MEYFLKELNIIRSEYEMLSKREEKFNIFTSLHKPHDERRLHSRFISVLLQPLGTHGQNAFFLKTFINQIKELYSFPITKDTIVYPSEIDKKENNNIDILVINRVDNKCIIIENKIYADDSNLKSGGQLERYIDHVVENEKISLDDISVLYLTLDGHEPSETSIGKYLNKKNVVLISYSEHIIPWLEICVKDVFNQPFLRESIIQYIKLLNKMTGNSSSREERLAYKQLISSSENNLKSAQKLYDNFKHIKWHAVHEFWCTLQEMFVDSEKCEVIKPFDKNSIKESKTNNCITDLTHYEVYRKGQSQKQKCILNLKTNSGFIVSVRFTAQYNHFYFGLPVSENKTEDMDKLLDDFKEYDNNSWMLIHKIFDNDIKFNNFNNNLTFSLINTETKDIFVKKAYLEVIELIDRIEKKADNTRSYNIGG